MNNKYHDNELHFILGYGCSAIITATIEVRNGYVSFSGEIGDRVNIEEFKENRLDDLLDDRWGNIDTYEKIDLLEDGERLKEDVFYDWEYDFNCNYQEWLDCSCTDYEIANDNGDTINFETVACGQIRDDNFKSYEGFREAIPHETYVRFMDAWKMYHLKTLKEYDEGIYKEILFLMDQLKKYEVHGDLFNDILEKIANNKVTDLVPANSEQDNNTQDSPNE